jgi:hypothetical protein
VGAVVATAGDPDVELAREVGVGLAPHEHRGEGAGHRGGVQELVRGQAEGWAADDVADIVHPGLQRDQPDVEQPVEDLRHVLDPDPPQLHLLARRDVHEPAPHAVGDTADGAEMAGGGDPVRDAETHHEVAGVLLAEEHPPPLQAVQIAFLDRLEAELRVARDVRAHVEPILAGLQLLDLVHALPW